MRQLTLFFGLIIAGFFYSCDDCNDCKELQQKRIIIQNENGTNLLFGTDATYNPDEATIVTSSGVQQPLFVDEDAGALLFSLEENEMTYTLHLNTTDSETINFELDERDSKQCCGTLTISTSTSLNGTKIENSDTIIIVK
ncbi:MULTISPECIES: hypothetical protein [Croceitalea]|uniref:Lipocalin-like domain-containing protein n=1 Tax=Croceitalea vernalis TaxID=3075599 RepID=A0ABU3BE95_9FLAO|nr:MULTISPECIES: hypothetical protein [unclassified Croceitalea]MDT0538686.1 hypothetical protein [Croceitalea sp. P059]MDT0620470.1 hypothetical protein [Croceitalea sp. P007]